MVKIALVTDSTAYIPGELSKAYNITIVPLNLIWGDQTYRDGVDIQPDEFSARLQPTKVMPTTSQVPVLDMQRTFQELVDKGFEVLGIFISANLSGTWQSAIQARAALGAFGEKVHVIDSNATSMAMGFSVLAAAPAAQQGASMNDCIALAEEACRHVGVYFVVETLEFLHRGGRIGGATRFIGSALNLKPILDERWTHRSDRPRAHKKQRARPRPRISRRTSQRQIKNPSFCAACKC